MATVTLDQVLEQAQHLSPVEKLHLLGQMAPAVEAFERTLEQDPKATDEEYSADKPTAEQTQILLVEIQRLRTALHQIQDHLAGATAEQQTGNDVGTTFDHAITKTDEAPTTPKRSLRGALADLGPAPSAEDIDEVRREMWANFPRDDM
jgi:hypothetical protein